MACCIELVNVLFFVKYKKIIKKINKFYNTT